jgi:hypothetical protein
MSWFKSKDQRKADKLEKLYREHEELVKNGDHRAAALIDKEIKDLKR